MWSFSRRVRFSKVDAFSLCDGILFESRIKASTSIDTRGMCVSLTRVQLMVKFKQVHLWHSGHSGQADKLSAILPLKLTRESEMLCFWNSVENAAAVHIGDASR